MARERWVVGNWKMLGDLSSNAALLAALKSKGPTIARGGAKLGVCVPAAYLAQAQALLQESAIAWGAQDVSSHAPGAYTGEIAPQMLNDFGAQICIVGHSERRANHGEGNSIVAAKAAALHAVGIRPIVCVGESLSQRDAGQTFDVVEAQLAAVLGEAAQAVDSMIVAYEPVWAIGTGQSASAQQAQEVHARIRAVLASRGAAQVPVIYGGSVKGSNAAALFSMRDIDGGLIGGASRIADEFLSIAAACAATAEA